MCIYKFKGSKSGKLSLQTKSSNLTSSKIQHDHDKTTNSGYLEIFTERFRSRKFRSRMRSSDSISSTIPCVNNDQCKTGIPEYAEILT